MFLDRVIHFGETLGDQVHVKVHVLTFNMILISSPKCVLTPSYPLRQDLGDKVKGGSPKNLKILMEVP